MKIFHKILISCLTAAAIFFAAGCSESDVDSTSGGGYGNVQFRLVKQTRAEQLDYLRDAYKVKVLLAQGDEQVNLSLLVNRAASDEIAEYGLNTEIGQLRVGEYDLQEYTVYNETDDVLLYGSPDEAIHFGIVAGGLARPELPLATQPRGRISFKFVKDFINVPTRAGEHRDSYLFSEIARATLTLKNVATSQTRRIADVECTYASGFAKDDPSGESPLQSWVVSTGSYPLEAGEWVLTTLELQDAGEDILEYLEDLDALDQPTYFTVVDNVETEAVVPVQVDCTKPHIRDYIALKKIWEKMNGEEWSWRGDSYFPAGANWDFNRDIDLWGNQPGVGLYANGRVSQLNLGGFNPSGAVPEELGELTELNSLYIGTHSDAMDSSMRPEYPGPTEYGAVHESRYTGYRAEFDPWARQMAGESLGVNRMERAAAEVRARHAKPENELFGRVEALSKGQTWKRNDATPYASVDYGIIMNHITSLPESIGNLTKLEYLYIANSTIESIPASVANLESVTDLEIYNCPAMTKFPREIAQMKNLISVNLGQNYQWEPEDMRQGLTELFDGPSREKLQILYIDHCRLHTFPSNGSNLKALGLLEATGCGLKEFPVAMGRDIRMVLLYLDYNDLTTFPEEFIGISDFEEISIDHNKLETFPSFFAGGEGYIGGEVSLEGNRISSMGPNFKGILCQTLNISYNRFTDLPPEFGPTESYVQQLNIAANQLDSLRGESLKGLSHTQVLDLSMNKLSKLPNIPLGSYMPYLTGVNVSNNCFSSWPTFFFNGYGIMTFMISDQRDPETAEKCFTEWPEGMEIYYPGLKQLDISGNDIREISSFPTTLYYLDIADNPNVTLEIPETICSAIVDGSFTFIYDQDQTGITGCADLGIGE